MDHIEELCKNYQKFDRYYLNRNYYGSDNRRMDDEKLLELRTIVTKIAGFYGSISSILCLKDKGWEITFISNSAPTRNYFLCPVATMKIHFSKTAGFSVIGWIERCAEGQLFNCIDEVEDANKRCEKINESLTCV